MTKMSMYSVVELGNGQYQCFCRIQDGVERWTRDTKQDAAYSLINAAKVLNGATITEKDIHFEAPMPRFTSTESSSLTRVIQAVDAEYRRAVSLHGPFSSTHEGYAIIQEEVDELWGGIKKNDSREALKEEAIQVAAMAIRFCIDI